MEPAGIQKFDAFVRAQFRTQARGKDLPPGERPLVTVSRQSGAGGISFAESLATLLTSRSPRGSVPWTVFDRNLVERVLAEHGLSEETARFMEEDDSPGLDDAVGEIIGLHPSRWHMVHQTTETILRLARMGNCILVGRGASIITSHLTGAFHVRLVGTEDARVAHLQEHLGVSRKAAREVMEKEDRGRVRYLKKYFRTDVNDPTGYHLVINTDRVGYEEAARIVGEAVLARSRRG